MRHISKSSSSHQRLMIRCLFGDLELPTDYITKLNLSVFDAAEVPRPTEGVQVDVALAALTGEQAGRLITALKQQKDG